MYLPPKSAYASLEVTAEYSQKQLSGTQINATFHKSWNKVIDSTPKELAKEQILHYLTSWDAHHDAEDVYIPDEVLNVPKVELKVISIEAVSKEWLVEKSLSLIESGVALKEDTVSKVLQLLVTLGHKFTDIDSIKNKEAQAIISHRIAKKLPSDPEAALRVLVYVATERTLLIKSDLVIKNIQSSRVDLIDLLAGYDLKKLSSIYNRYKPLFLAFKKISPDNATLINRLGKLSKKHHKPLPATPLNLVTQRKLVVSDCHWIESATIYATLKAMSACYARMNGQRDFNYLIRNGKSWTRSHDEFKNKPKLDVCQHNFTILMAYLKDNYYGNGQAVLIPQNVEYAIPTSEKMFIGSIPIGTEIISEGMCVGVYWKNSWGAKDIDVSAVNIAGKVGWNSTYKNERNSLVYSGDKTTAPRGACEYMYTQPDAVLPESLIMTNIWNGSDEASYHIIIGDSSDTSYDFMLDPNNLIASIPTRSIQKQMILGLLTQREDKQTSFTLMDVGAGGDICSRVGEKSEKLIRALTQKYTHTINLEQVLTHIGYKVIRSKDEATQFVDLSIREVKAADFMNLFETAKVKKG